LLTRRFRAAAAITRPPEHLVDHSGGASYSRLNGRRSRRTVSRAGAAFHAGVPIRDGGFSRFHLKDGMGTDFQTHAATGALLNIQRQCSHIF